ncbi:hypothetical protein H4R99_003245 [Coemansia sp. RSA 1722]|nr:hypothetical protein LPJ57_004244 [Coemansia sp. RSA 486]KAJ2234914.1 hypothetical protein IWW45_003032 [Coemansia sp. RSA 485]KAJ2600698.1 hypothetical protein H4R99_003245 [Coemansia sp. RSA 1722]
MANQSAKRIVQQNATRLAMLQKLFLGINVFYLFISFVFQRSSQSWTGIFFYIGKLVIEVFLLSSLQNSARPRYDPGGALADPGTDLGQPGLVQYMFDYLYIMWFVRLLSLVTKWASVVYLVIPAYLIYAFGPYVKQFLGMNGAAKTEKGDAEQDEAKLKKRQEKKERKQQRVRYARH